MPSASTELFLRLEAAAGHEQEASAAGLQDHSQPSVVSSHAHAANGHHAAPDVHRISPPLQAQLPEARQQQQQQQPQKLQQQLSHQEEDVYTSLERGSDTVPTVLPGRYTAVAMTNLPRAQYAPAHTVKQDAFGCSTVPQQVPSRTAPEQGFPRKGPEHGPRRHRDPAELECKAEPSGKVTPKAAEAPLVKQGSYALAAKMARLRNKRRQQEIEGLNGGQRQVQIAPGGKQHAVQVGSTLPVMAPAL